MQSLRFPSAPHNTLLVPSSISPLDSSGRARASRAVSDEGNPPPALQPLDTQRSGGEKSSKLTGGDVDDVEEGRQSSEISSGLEELLLEGLGTP